LAYRLALLHPILPYKHTHTHTHTHTTGVLTPLKMTLQLSFGHMTFPLHGSYTE